MSLFLISMGLSAAIVAGSAVCGWIACWLWTTRTRRPARHVETAGGLRRPTPTDDAGLLAEADDRLRATHRHDRTSVMHTHPAGDRQIRSVTLPDPRTGDLLATAETRVEVAP